MRIIISPAKKMKYEADMGYQSLPIFLGEAQKIFATLKAKQLQELKKIWKCNEKIATENAKRLYCTELHKDLIPALLSYEGIQYQYMKPNIFAYEEWDYVNEHLRILSGLYGVLKPMDGIVPYRLEMQAKLQVNGAKDLYEFWGERLREQLFSETDLVIDLASNEYSQCIRKGLKAEQRYIECVFAVCEDEDKLKVKATWAKMARGEMVRFMASNNCKRIDDLKEFNEVGYSFCEAKSNENKLVFLRQNITI